VAPGALHALFCVVRGGWHESHGEPARRRSVVSVGRSITSVAPSDLNTLHPFTRGIR
jgi:hypothetical protein